MPYKREERLEVRVTSEQKRMIKSAADLLGSSITDFVVSSTQQAATATINNYQTLELRGEACKVFVNALLNPPAPSKAALQAAREYKKITGS